MFNIELHRNEYHHKGVTVIKNILSSKQCEELRTRAFNMIENNEVLLVNHEGKGNSEVSDLGGKYYHHIFLGQDIRDNFPELTATYTAILPLVGMVTSLDAILSPYIKSNINIKAYPSGGGALGKHYDSNAITALIFLTTNTEAPLLMHLKKEHPSKTEPWYEEKIIYAEEGALLLLKGRDVLHECEPTKTESKLSVILNYYTLDDQYRNEKFDDFAYYGEIEDNHKEKLLA